jgi:tripartite-type tricarboxylate transporter receptor subunit TctC
MHFRLALFMLGLMAVVSQALAQSYPEKTVRIVVPFAPGSATDIVARLIAEELRGSFNQSFVVDNRPGASGQPAAEAVAKSAPDGYTLFVTTNTTHSANPHLFKQLRYDPIKDFAPVARILYIPVILVVDPRLPVNSLGELIKYAKDRPGKLSFAHGNSIGQVSGTSFTRRAGLDIQPVAYKSSPQAMTDVIGGQVAFTFADMASGQSHVNSGRLRALALTSNKRSALMPALPTMSDTPGLEGFDVTAWVGALAPAGTPRDIVAKLNTEIGKSLAKPEVKARIDGFFADTAPSTPEEFSDYLKQQLDTWGRLVREAGIQPE